MNSRGRRNRKRWLDRQARKEQNQVTPTTRQQRARTRSLIERMPTPSGELTASELNQFLERFGGAMSVGLSPTSAALEQMGRAFQVTRAAEQQLINGGNVETVSWVPSPAKKDPKPEPCEIKSDGGRSIEL